MFHCLADNCANTLVGGPGSDRSEPAWHQTYRALEHGLVSRRYERTAIMRKFPPEIRGFADKFVDMQAKRHKSDYDPEANFSKVSVSRDIDLVEQKIVDFYRVRVKDRRAFAVYVLLNLRNL